MLINPVGHLLQGFDEIIERSLPYAEGGKICEDFVHLTQLWLSRMQVAISFAIPYIEYICQALEISKCIFC
jgi:hypothetical protein